MMRWKSIIASVLVSFELAGYYCGRVSDAFSPPPHTCRGLAERRHKIPFITHTNMHETNTGEPEKPKALTPDTVAEMAEVSFVNACLQLAQGCVRVHQCSRC